MTQTDDDDDDEVGGSGDDDAYGSIMMLSVEMVTNDVDCAHDNDNYDFTWASDDNEGGSW